jgi:prepilin-type processing-associated H-X9-DG protein
MQINLFPLGWTVNSVQQMPFGNAGATDLPLQQARISTRPLSQTWMLADLDREWLNGATPGWVNQIPATSAHGSRRNILYFDGRVGAIASGPRPANL